MEELTVDNPLLFNDCKLVKDPIGEGISLIQKEQGQRLELVDFSSPTFKQAYLEQRALGAYIATICQPERLATYPELPNRRTLTKTTSKP